MAQPRRVGYTCGMIQRENQPPPLIVLVILVVLLVNASSTSRGRVGGSIRTGRPPGHVWQGSGKSSLSTNYERTALILQVMLSMDLILILQSSSCLNMRMCHPHVEDDTAQNHYELLITMIVVFDAQNSYEFLWFLTLSWYPGKLTSTVSSSRCCE
jgi:hypothetical protein